MSITSHLLNGTKGQERGILPDTANIISSRIWSICGMVAEDRPSSGQQTSMNYFERATAVNLFEEFDRAHPELEFIRHVWVDLSGILRQRILTMPYCRQIYSANRRYGVGPAVMRKNISHTSLEGFCSKQQVCHIVPDWYSTRICHFSPGHAWVMCFAHCAQEPDPFFQCPRFALARVLERFEAELSGADALFGCETEFIVLDLSLQALQSPDNVVGWCTMTGLRDRKLEMVEDVVRTLQKSDIGVTHFHCEEPQQLELSTYPFPPMQAVDSLYYTQECLRVIALRHGYRATVAIKPLPPPHETTSTVGLHFSLSGIATAEHDHFLAGVLKQLPVMTPFAMPTHDSYHRTSVDRYGTWICWGTENRDVAIRKIKAGHWELRLCDATANFFLLGTILLSVGLDGVSAKQILSMRDLRSPSTQVSSEVLEAHGIYERLTSSFRDSLKLVRKSDYIGNLLGQEMKSLWLTTKELDEDALCRMSDEERRKAYLQHF